MTEQSLLNEASYALKNNAVYLCCMQTRIATIDDVPFLAPFVNNAYRGEGSKKGWTTEADLLDGIRTSEASLARSIQHPSAVILLAEEAQTIAGCVYLEKKGKALYLGMLTVRPDLQGKGIGDLLMKKAEERAIHLGCIKIQMTVITARESLIAFYQRRGYRDTGERLPFPDDPAFGIPKQPLAFLVMEKVLHNSEIGKR